MNTLSGIVSGGICLTPLHWHAVIFHLSGFSLILTATSRSDGLAGLDPSKEISPTYDSEHVLLSPTPDP